MLEGLLGSSVLSIQKKGDSQKKTLKRGDSYRGTMKRDKPGGATVWWSNGGFLR